MSRLIFATLGLIALAAVLSPVAAGADILQGLRPGHPRLLVLDADLAAVRQAIAADPLVRAWHKQLTRDAQRLLTAPPVEHKLIGPRLLDQSRRALQRISTLAGLYRLDGDRRFAERARREMLAAAAFPDWNPSHFLDVAEMTNALALGYDWLFDFLSPEDRSTIRTALIVKGLQPGLVVYRSGKGWAKVHHNWNQVCNGGLVERRPAPGRRGTVAGPRGHRPIAHVHRPGHGLVRPGRRLGGGSGLLELRHALQRLLPHRAGDGAGDGLRPQAAAGPCSDGRLPHPVGRPARPDLQLRRRPRGAGHRRRRCSGWPTTFGQPATPGTNGGWRRAAGDFHLLLVRNGDGAGAGDEPRDDCFAGSTSLFSAAPGTTRTRPSWASTAATTGPTTATWTWAPSCWTPAACAGPLDLGGDNYNLPGYFGRQRWTYYRLRTEGHNTLTIDGANQALAAHAPLRGLPCRRRRRLPWPT